MNVYRAAIHQRLDEGIIVVRHLLIIGAQEAQRLVVVVSLGIIPGHRLMANVGEVLPCRGAQQLQEGHLYCADGVFCHVNVVQLKMDRKRERQKRERGKKGEREIQKEQDKDGESRSN